MTNNEPLSVRSWRLRTDHWQMTTVMDREETDWDSRIVSRDKTFKKKDLYKFFLKIFLNKRKILRKQATGNAGGSCSISVSLPLPFTLSKINKKTYLKKASKQQCQMLKRIWGWWDAQKHNEKYFISCQPEFMHTKDISQWHYLKRPISNNFCNQDLFTCVYTPLPLLVP